ncbi:hypothetical protein LCGC14_0145770 [marine sediment metagenome]|uniref:DUF5698 domain-containing protein n=1 Tax=marine sediment metagenome TaxID=412755 RepID=A0A0F9XHB7_9ZZZZ
MEITIEYLEPLILVLGFYHLFLTTLGAIKAFVHRKTVGFWKLYVIAFVELSLTACLFVMIRYIPLKTNGEEIIVYFFLIGIILALKKNPVYVGEDDD